MVEILLLIVVVLVGGYAWLNARSKRIVRHHAVTLSRVTGVPAEQIADEMLKGQLTPGQWAARRGLNPMTFEPQGGVSESKAREMAEELWERIRLTPDTPLPGPDDLVRVGDLQEELANLRRDVPLAAEIERHQQVLVALHRLGARVDAEFVNGLLRADGVTDSLRMAGPAAQHEYDAMQRKAVQGGG